MSASLRPSVADLRGAGVVFAAGLAVGALYWAIGVTSPAPPPLGLVGLLGIVIGELLGRRLLAPLRRRTDPSTST